MRLINADDLVNKIVFYTKIPIPYKERVEDAIQDMPTVDAVEVVRCKDCIHCADDYVDTGFGAMPTFTCDIFEGYGVGIKPDHYCSYGERGEQDDNTGSD